MNSLWEKRSDLNLDYRVDIKKWNTEIKHYELVKTYSENKTSATKINTKIQRIETLVNNVFKELGFLTLFVQIKLGIPVL